ncbi:hypothetical protein [Streptomyces sp. NPDC002343]
MDFCVHCGTRVEDAARPDCPDCGAPRAAGQPAGSGYVRVGSTRLPVWLPWALLAVLVAGGVTLGVALASRPGTPSADGLPGVSVSAGTGYGGWGGTPTTDGAFTTPDDAHSADYGGSGGYDDDRTTPSSEPSDEAGDASEVVTAYYDHLNAGDFAAAWAMGGDRLYGGSYTDWVAGFSSTARIDVTATDNGGGEVAAEIRATQSDGSVQVFRGTYTVSGGKLVGADIRQVS